MDSSSSDESASESSLPSIFKDNKQDDSDSTEDCTMPTFLSKENNMCPILIPDDNDSLQFSLEEKEDYPGMSPSSTKRDAFSEFYQNDRQLPIYKTSNCGIPTKEVVLLLLSDLRDGQISRNIPYTINKNVSFVYNVNDIGHWKNALCDGMGTWDQMGTETVYAAIAGEDDISLFRKKNANTNIKVIRRKYINGSSSDLHRIAITLHDTENNLLNKMFVQYYFIGNEKNIRVKPHGNTRKTEKFERTKETTKDKIKKMCYENKTNKDMFNILIEDEGGLENVKSGSNIARNKKQVANFKLHGKVASDPLLELSELAKDQENSDKRFVRDVRSAPEFTIFLANNRQLNDLERFCTNPDGFSILGIDTTFNIGQYYVTISTYRNMLMLTEKHVEPVMVGPILIHQKKSFDSYFKLTSSIIQEKPSMKDLKVFGTDGDVCLSQACEASFSKAEHLLCDIHMYDNISKKLQSLNIPKDVSKTVLCDIFGIIRHDTKVPGLVDSVTDKEYDEKLSNLTRKWRDLHANGNEFVNYFLEYKSQLVKNCMSASLRSRCGLGCPPNPYTQNANECVNSVIKSDIRHEKGLKSINPYECVAMLEKVVMRQETELKLAVIGKGSWHLKEEYQHLSVPEDEYWNKTNKQREAVHKRYFHAPNV